jgi:hypothetical protein
MLKPKLTGIFVQFRMKIKKFLPLQHTRTAADIADKVKPGQTTKAGCSASQVFRRTTA